MRSEMQDQKILHKSRLPARTVVIPAGKSYVYYANKEESDRIVLLDGEYDFKYRDGEWGKIDVPSMWQFRGYGTPRYTNVDYIFPFNPPFVGHDVPIGYYKRIFEIKELRKTLIHFDGVDSGFFLRVNGREVGMSKGARLMAEFDLTDFIRVGENTLEVDVYGFCDGSYLESQDMILANGIFRDVYLILLDEVNVWDYTLIPDKDSLHAEVKLDYHGETGYKLVASFASETVEKDIDSDTIVFDFKVKNPILWNAENPYLYDFVLEIEKDEKTLSVVSKRVGLRKVEILKNHLFSINGVPIKLKGVNRHEYTPTNGRAIDYKTTRYELEEIKKYNLNAVRCSHYPNNPFFYEIANELGIYVMDEADLETHGCGTTGDQGFLSKSPAWEAAYLDRQVRMYERDKNETCVVIFSVGNECGNGENLVKCAEYLRTRPASRPIHYPQDNGADPQFIDFRQNGYEYVSALDTRHGETGPYYKKGDTPVILTEYSHSMGNSNGNLKAYWDRIYAYEEFAGGFIWEFKNLGIKHGADFLYGGDFGEANHASNFSLDGLFFSDGTPKPAMNEVREVMSPVQTYYDNGIFIKNTNSFTSLKGIKIEWQLLEDYKVIDEGVTECPDVKPFDRVLLNIPYTMPEKLKGGASYFVNLKYTQSGRLISSRQVTLPFALPKEKAKSKKFEYKIENNTLIAKDFKVGFSDGRVSYIEKNGKVLINGAMKPCFWRRPTDNDGIEGKKEKIMGAWESAKLKYFDFYANDTKIEEKDGSCIFTFDGITAPEGKFVGYFTRVVYTVYDGCRITCEMTSTPYGNMPTPLPRLGVVFELDKKYDGVTYYGRGEHENYDDRKFSANFGLYKAKVGDMHVDYERPQDNGARCDTRYAALSDGKDGLLIVGADKFTFEAHDYSLMDLSKARHRSELKRSDKNYFFVDYKQRGLGSASCGPQPLPEYELTPHAFCFSFVIAPFVSEDEALELSRTDFGIKSYDISDKYEFTPIASVKENFESRFD